MNDERYRPQHGFDYIYSVKRVQFSHKGFLITPVILRKPVLVGMNDGTNRYMKHVWRVLELKTGRWSYHGTKDQARRFINSVKGARR